MQITTIGIDLAKTVFQIHGVVDLAKNVFQVHGVDRNEKPVWKRKLKA